MSRPNVALLPRLFNQPDGTIKIKGVRTTVSSLRQSQLVTTYGPGAMIDLPWFAAVLSGLDFWDKGVRISEPRLEAKAKAVLGIGFGRAGDSAGIRQSCPTRRPRKGSSHGGSRRWSLTKETRRASDPDKRTYQTRMMVPLPWVDEQTGFYEGPDFDDPSKTRKFAVVPIRFIRACKNGHMGDIDWCYFVHRRENGMLPKPLARRHGHHGRVEPNYGSGANAVRPVSSARPPGRTTPRWERCDSSQQWLGPAADADEGCTETSRLLIRTASNAYFPQKLSVISMPDRGQALYTCLLPTLSL